MGNILDVTDSSGINLSTINPYTYRGYRYDKEINMYYLNNRFYSPETHRFLNADGLLGEQGNILGHNMYAYTQNNPVMYVDPSGYFSLEFAAVLTTLAILAEVVVLVLGVVIAAMVVGAVTDKVIGEVEEANKDGKK